MICERCKKNQATVHLTEVIKDIRSEIHICEDCAKEIGLNSKLSGFSLSVSEMLSFLESGNIHHDEEPGCCPRCGTSFMDYRRDERLGCPECYHYLGDPLVSIIISCHENRKFAGKKPLLYGIMPCLSKNLSVADEKIQEPLNFSLEDLRQRLDEAVKDERYEDAAALRDRIRSGSVRENGYDSGK